jgi:FkbM family methyltransferase
MKRLLARLVNSALRPLDMHLLPGWELRALKTNNPRLELFLRLSKRGFRPTHVVDVGAHKGQWSLDAHRVFPDCAFTLVEPLAEMKPYLDRACRELKRAKWVVAGAGEANGTLEFTVQPNLYAASSFSVPEALAREKGLERRSVPVVTVDSLCEQSEFPTPEVVKIDAEGLDLAVVRGARKLIGVAELFFLESPLVPGNSDQTFHSMVEFMKTNGYEPYDFTEFVRDPADGTLGAVEIAFARRDGYLRRTYRNSW